MGSKIFMEKQGTERAKKDLKKSKVEGFEELLKSFNSQDSVLLTKDTDQWKIEK